MLWVFIAASAIALATFTGTAAGYLFKNISLKMYNIVIGFSAGVMLCAAVFGLIEPSVEYGGAFAEIVSVAGIGGGVLFLSLIDKIMPKLNRAIGIENENSQGRVLLLAMAIAVHHFPEGLAAGVSFGTEAVSEIVMVCGGITIQNIPEAAVLITPLLQSGVSSRRSLIIALISGGVEIVGTFWGYFAVTVAEAIMPFALAFAGGSMIYIIIDEMVPQTHNNSAGSSSSYSALAGFCFMLLADGLIERFTL